MNDVSPLVLAQERRLPVDSQLQHLLPFGGLQRGSTVAVGGAGGAISLAFALLAESARQGSWIAILGAESLGLAALKECGVPLQQVVLVDNVAKGNVADPESASRTWADAAGALVDGFDVVVMMRGRKGPRVTASTARRLAVRARDRGTVLVSVGRGWGAVPDVQLTVTDARWFGVAEGSGYLRSRQVKVSVGGRRGAGPLQTHSLWLPDETGCNRLVADDQYAGSDIDALVAADASGHELEGAEGSRKHLRAV